MQMALAKFAGFAQMGLLALTVSPPPSPLGLPLSLGALMHCMRLDNIRCGARLGLNKAF